MLRRLTGRLVLAAGWALTTLAVAHESTGPNGGKVADFGAYHLEGVLDGDTARFYLLDDDGKPTTLKKHDGGTITIAVPGEKAGKTGIPADAPFGEVSAPVRGKGKVTANVKLKTKGKTMSATFKFSKK